VGTTNLLRLDLAGLPERSRRLWALVSAELEEAGDHADDLRRLRTTLALRGDGAFFQRLGARWEELRRDLFGDAFLLPTLLSLLPDGMVIADLGCGTGEIVAALSAGSERVIGIDREPAMLEIARQRTAHLPNVTLTESGLESLPVDDDSLDAALCMLVLHHVETPAAVFAECARVLRPGGRLVVLDMVAHDHAEYRRTMGHRHLGFDAETLSGAGLALQRWTELPEAPGALGPPLFVGVFRTPIRAG